MTESRIGSGTGAVRRGGAMRKVLIALGVVLVIVVALVVAAPTILSGVAGGIIAGALNANIAGEASVSKVSLSWSGPQRIGSIVLEDPSGARVGELSASVDAGLLGLATGSRDLGTIRVRGALDLREDKDGELNLASALASTRASRPITVPPGGSKPTTPSAPGEIRVPKSLAFRIDASEIEVRYTPRGGTATPIGLKTTKGDATFAAGKPVDVELEADTLDGRRALTVGFHADRLTDDQGVLALHDAKIELSIDGALPKDYADTLADAFVPAPDGNVTVGAAPDGGMTLSAKFVSQNGRLRLADPTTPALLTGRLPDVLVRQVSAGEGEIHFDTAPRVSFGIQDMDLPLPKSGSLLDADFRGAVLKMALSTDPIAGTATLEEGGAPKAFAIDPIQPKLYQLDQFFDQTITCTGSATFGDMKAGTYQVDLRAAGLLNQDGKLRIGPFAPKGEGYTLVPGPEYLRGVVRVFEFPTALIQPLLEGTGVVLERVAGPTLAMDIRAGVRQGTDELPKEVTSADGKQLELPPVGEPYLAATLDSRKMTAWIDLFLDADRIKTRNKGIKIQSDAGAELVRAFVPEDQISLDGEGKAIIEFTEVDIPMVGGKPDMRGASMNGRVVFGGFDAQTSKDAPPVRVESLDTAIGFTPNETPTWGVDWRGGIEGQRFAIVGNGDVVGLIPQDAKSATVMGMSPADARPTGRLKLLDVPTRLASLVSARAAEIAEAGIGSTIKGTVDSSRKGDGARVDIAIEGTKAAMQGGLDADSRAVTLDDKGLTITLLEPGALLNSLAAGGEKPSPLRLDNTGQATLTISKTTIPLRDRSSETPLKGVTASAKLTANGIGGTVQTEQGSAPLALTSLDASLALTPAGDVTMDISSDGTVAQQATTSSGTLAVRGLRDEAGRVDLSKARLDGSWSAKNVPTSLVAIVDPDQAEIVREMIGDSIDVALTSQPSAGSRGGWDVKATGREFLLTSRVGLGESQLHVGPTSAHAVLTPGAVEAAMAAYQPALSPRPSLAAPTAVDLTGDAFSIPLGEKGGKLEIAASLKTASDLILTNLPGVEKGKTSTLGVRGLLVTAKPAGGKTDVTLTSSVFDPATKQEVAAVNGSTSLPMEGLSGTLSVSNANTAALDTMLATNGLLAEAAGKTLSVDVRASAPKGAESVPLVAEVRSPRLEVDAELVRSAAGVELTKPARAKWLVSKATAQRLLFPAKEGQKPALVVNDDFGVSLDVQTLRLGPADALLQPDVLRLASEIHLDGMSFTDMKSNQSLAIPARAGRIGVDPSSGALNIALHAEEGAGAPSTGASSAGADAPGDLKIDATITDFADSAGQPTPEQARITSTVTGELPSALVDSLASMDGMLTALVGPRMKADIRTVGLSQKAGVGTLSADVQAPYANLKLQGAMAEGSGGRIFALSEPGQAELTRITNEASEKLLGVLFPLLTRFEKTESDTPAVVKADGLTLPLDDDLRDLNGVLHVSPGTMAFQTKGFFSKILKATHNKQSGQIGRKLQPFDITIERGIANYQDVTIPTGEFDFITSGKVNLVKKTMDVYIYVPIFAVEDNLASVVKNIPGVGNLTRVPISVKGDFDNPNVSVDPQEMIRSLPSNLGKGAEDILKTPGNILDNIFGGGDKKSDDADKSKDDKKKNDKKKNGGGGGGG